MKKLTIEFPFSTPTGWKFKGNKGSGWKVLAGWNKRYDRFLSNYNLVKAWQAKGPRKIVITRYHKNGRDRIKDDVNLREGCKPLVDALVRAGLLYKDTTEYLLEVYAQKIGEPKTIVEISEI